MKLTRRGITRNFGARHLGLANPPPAVLERQLKVATLGLSSVDCMPPAGTSPTTKIRGVAHAARANKLTLPVHKLLNASEEAGASSAIQPSQRRKDKTNSSVAAVPPKRRPPASAASSRAADAGPLSQRKGIKAAKTKNNGSQSARAAPKPTKSAVLKSVDEATEGDPAAGGGRPASPAPSDASSNSNDHHRALIDLSHYSLSRLG